MNAPERMRIDKWLWAARFYKTRGLAAEELDRGRIEVNGSTAKPARDVKPGDTIVLRQAGGVVRTLQVLALSMQRGPAPAAQLLYEESAASRALREAQALQRRLAPEPAAERATARAGRPTKRDRRLTDAAAAPWGTRWSASVDGE